MAYQRNEKYSEETNSAIRFNIISALQELADFNGIDINTIKTTSPYSYELNQVTSQKIAAELKKMIDLGFVVKGKTKGKTVKYMLRDRYESLIEDKKLDKNSYGYGDYRDDKKESEDEDEISNRILSTKYRKRYTELW